MSDKPQLRRVYGDILRGMSLFLSPLLGNVYIKHSTPLDTCDNDVVYNRILEDVKSKGLPTEEKQLEYLAKKEMWLKKDDDEVEELTKFVASLRQTKSKLNFPSQRDAIERQIQDNVTKLNKKLTEKRELIGLTAEDFAAQKVNEHYLKSMTFSNPELTKNLFSEDEYNNLEDDKNLELINIFIKFNNLFKQELLKKTALLPLFLNAFSLCKDSPFIFYGKPVVQLTTLQVDLFSFGRTFRNIISEHGDKIPAEYYDDPDKLIDWHESARNTEELLSKQPESGNVMLFGTTKEDIKKLGLDGQVITGANLAEKARANGGKLNMKDLMALEGN